jgi:UDP-N-acetylmuramyl pentapeptide synthase
MWKSAEMSAIIDGRIFGPRESTFENCVIDSRLVIPGSLFFAIPGKKTDGHGFIRKAWEAGASIVVASGEGYKDHFCSHISPLAEKDIAFTVPPGKTLILVQDTLKALQKLAYIWLGELDAVVVAVTGSNGKTTTKDMIAAVLSAKFQVHKTPENFNTEIGLPLSVLHAPRGTEVFVLEMGMRGLGEISLLCQICRPSIGVVTNIGNTHIELLGSQEAISQAKWELVASLPPEGVAVLNSEDSETAAMIQSRGMRCQKVFFGAEGRYGDMQIQAYNVEAVQPTGTRFEVECGIVDRSETPRRACDRLLHEAAGQEKVAENMEAVGLPQTGVPAQSDAPEIAETAEELMGKEQNLETDQVSTVNCLPPAAQTDYSCKNWNVDRRQSPYSDRRNRRDDAIVVELPLPGSHNVLNALAALAVGRVLNVSLQEGIQGLANLSLSKMRLEFVPGIGGCTIINDAYNANPASMKASLQILRERSEGATIAVLGDMFELGQLALSQHLVIGAEAASLGITHLVTLGSLAENIARGALESGFPADRVFHCQSHEEAAERTLKLIRETGPGSWVLVKASRGMEMERISSCLMENEGQG